MLEKLTRSALRHRFAILTIWLLVIILGVFAGGKLNDQLTTSLTVPGSESARASQILSDQFDENIEGSFTVIYKFKNATPDELVQLNQSVATAAQTIPTAKVVAHRALGGVLYVNISTSYDLLKAATYTDTLRAALVQVGLSKALVSGPPAIERDVTPILKSDLRHGQGIAIIVALLLLILMLGACWAIYIPLIFALASVSLALGIISLLAQKFLMVLYIPNIVELIGLGLAIDYSLLILHRFRRELMNHPELNSDEVIARTMKTAGRTVVISGLSVSIALATLFLVPVPFVRSLGLAAIIVPLACILTALTLQPALLSIFGRKATLPAGFKGLIGRTEVMSGLWAKLARGVVARPRVVFATALVILLAIASSVLFLQVTPSSLTAIPQNLQSAKALAMITDRVGNGVITPIEIAIDLGAPQLSADPDIALAKMTLITQIQDNPHTFLVAAGQEPTFTDPTGQYMRIIVIATDGLGDASTKELVKKLRFNYIPEAGFPKSVKLYVGGAPAQGVDLVHTIFASFPWIILLIPILTFLILMRAMRSVILPIKAIALDLLSIATALSALVLVFKFGFASSLLGTYRLDQIEVWVVIFLFAVLFGLSMDYEVFLVSRMREARDNGASNSQAIVEGLAHTGTVVSAAAVILVGAVSGLINGHFAGLQQLGIGLAVGILIDATLIRGLLLPSSMVLLGRWNWWLPEGIARVLKTKASPLDEPEVRL